jgi:hypothetical protein
MKPELTQARLKELLHYDPETGVFTWLVARGRYVKPGTAAGSHDRAGYLRIGVSCRIYAAHRLAFLYMTGETPTEVDHINRVKDDNRWSNLRSASRSENVANTPLRRDNSSGYRGVGWYPRYKKWCAKGRLCGKSVHLGYFASLEEAAEVARKWREDNFGIFAAA